MLSGLKLELFKKVNRKVFLAVCVATILMTLLYAAQDGRPPPPPGYPCLPNETSITTPLKHNMAIVRNYPFPGLEKYREKLGLNDKVGPVSRNVPVIATGCSSNHFPEAMQMLNNLRVKLYDSYDDIQIYFYDLGLDQYQKDEIMEFPRVHLRAFPFSEYPDHVGRLKGYAWKPIIMQLVLREFGFVMWLDASIRLIYANIDVMTQIAKENGIAFRHANSSLNPHTDLDTFKYLNESPCNFRFYTEIEANVMLLYRTQFINDYIMKPVVSCALSYGCLVTKNSAAIRVCPDGHKPDHVCHRFDQAVFAIVIRRLFQNDPKYWIPHSSISGIYACRGPERFSKLLPDVINNQITKVKLFINEKNHARCTTGASWYDPYPWEE